MKIPVLLFASTCFLASFAERIKAQPPAADPTFWQDIRPVLRKHCTVCHSARNLKETDVSGGLALDTYEAARKGTKHPVIEPGKSDKSILVQLLESKDEKKRMPLDAAPLPKETIALVRRWIDAGAKEGTRPEDAPEPAITKKSSAVRKRDVIFATQTTVPAGVVGKAAGKLELGVKVGPLSPVAAVAFSPDGKLLAVGSYGQVAVWDLASARPVKVLTNVLGAVHDLKFSPDGKLLAVGGGQPSGKGELRLYAVGDYKLIATLRGHDDVVFSLAFRADAKRIVTGSFDHTVRLWDTDSHQQLQLFPSHSDFVYAVAFSPDGKRIVSASKDRSVRLIDADTGKSLFTFSGMNEDVMAVAFSPDGKNVISSGFETSIYWWDPQTGEKSKAQGGHGVAVHELAFSKDGKRIVSAGADRTARIWDGANAAPALKVLPVGSSVYAVAISSDGKTVASGSFDGLVRLWSEASGKQLATLLALTADNDQIDWIASTPEGYTAGSDPMLSVGQWRLGSGAVAGDKLWPMLRQPDLVARAIRGESLAEPKFAK